MDILKLYLKCSKALAKSKGFTLIELLVAIVMSGIVVTALGSGMMAILNSTKTSASKTDVKDQLNRAIDYINDDIKKARISEIKESVSGSGVNDTVILTYFEGLSNSTPNTIEYYLTASSNPWLGPKVLRRKVNGGQAQVLVDRLTENAINAGDFSCAGSKTTLSIGGFQACIDTTTASNGSPLYRTRIALFGELSDTTGSQSNSSTLKVSTDTISRSVTPVLDPPILSFAPDGTDISTDVTPDIQWSPVQGAASYTIYKCVTTDAINKCDPSANKTVLGSDTSSPWTLNDPTSTTGSRTCYQGISVNGSVTSANGAGNIICTIIAAAAAPSKIENLDATDVIQPEVTWNRDPNATDYLLYRCETSNPATPCTITPGTDTPIATFTAITDAGFSDYVPWKESQNTNSKPSDNKAFCYGVVTKNAAGSSPISKIDCGATNVPLTLNTSWNIQFTTFDTTAIKPQGTKWNTATGVTKFEMRRCEAATEAACDPTTGTATIVIDDVNVNPINYNEASTPAPGNLFCYAVRGKSDTQVSAFSTKKCGTQRPPECTLDLKALGLGATPSYKSSATASDRQILMDIVKGPFYNIPTDKNLDNGSGQVLYLIKDATTGSSLAGVDSRSLPCDTKIEFTWYYPSTTFGAPTIKVDLPSSTAPTISWAAVPTATKYFIRTCYSTSQTVECAPAANTETTNTSYTTSNSAKPKKGERICYSVRAYNGTTSASSNVVCGDWNP